jgi:Flp pilus assembly protein TadG
LKPFKSFAAWAKRRTSAEERPPAVTTDRFAMPHRSRVARGGGSESGQSIVEVALVLPIALLLLAGAVDMGRLFYARVSIENGAREGAMFGATNPRCDTDARDGCSDPDTAEWRVLSEASALGDLTTTFTCFNGSARRASVTGCVAGDAYVVTVADEFDFVTPILEPLFGPTITLEASASSAVLNSAFDPSAPPVSIEPPLGTGCVVPDWLTTRTRANSAEDKWEEAGFDAANFTKSGQGNFWIGTQSLPAGPAPCSSSITVTP